MSLKSIAFGTLLFCSNHLFAQYNPAFFPNFTAYPANPIVKYGDGFADAAWGDPCVIKEGNQYVMYATAAVGIILSDSNKVKVYRHVSNDGYNWTLSPSTPILEPLSGTYYSGGTETPSVVVKDGVYHMYLTCYPPGNDPSLYVLGHATSPDGIAWTMDPAPILGSDQTGVFYSELVGEPGAMVYHDSIHVFFTGAGIVGGNFAQGIGWMKSADGTNFTQPELAVSAPASVYPLSSDYWGLSTPSPIAINDSIYLFTDVAQTINGQWTQVALHHFKTDGVSGIWNYSPAPLHHMQDFNWTAGDYLSNLLAPCALMDANGLLRIWYSGHRIADIVGTDTTYNVTIGTTGMIHVLPNYFGIGTSSFQFAGFTAMDETTTQQTLSVFPNPSKGTFLLDYQSTSTDKLSIVNAFGQDVEFRHSGNEIELLQPHPGMYFLSLERKGRSAFTKLVVMQ
jgi:hypothetical protein